MIINGIQLDEIIEQSRGPVLFLQFNLPGPPVDPGCLQPAKTCSSGLPLPNTINFGFSHTCFVISIFS